MRRLIRKRIFAHCEFFLSIAALYVGDEHCFISEFKEDPPGAVGKNKVMRAFIEWSYSFALFVGGMEAKLLLDGRFHLH